MVNDVLDYFEQSNATLKKVSAFYNIYDNEPSSDIEMLRLDFTEFSIQITISSDDDSLHISLSNNLSNFDIEKDISNTEPWSGCIGCFIGEYYVMTNNRGYKDALQFEFINSYEVIQLYGIASRICVRSVISRD